MCYRVTCFCVWAELTPRVVYPETKGVPLEEMDAVFGEGECPICPFLNAYLMMPHHIRHIPRQTEEEEERLEDEESEQASLMSRQSRQSRISTRSKPPRGVLSRIMRQSSEGRRGGSYQPILDAEE